VDSADRFHQKKLGVCQEKWCLSPSPKAIDKAKISGRNFRAKFQEISAEIIVSYYSTSILGSSNSQKTSRCPVDFSLKPIPMIVTNPY